MKRNALIIIAIGILSTLAFAEVRYTVTDLGTLGDVTQAAGINDLGQVVGYSKLPDGNYHAFRWDPNEINGTTGVMVDLSVLPGKTLSNAYDINNSGHVVGQSDGYGFIHDGSQMVALSTAGIPSEVLSVNTAYINESGQIAGSFRYSHIPGQSRCYRWDPDTPNATTGTMKDIGTLGGGGIYYYANSINDNGQVCGYGQPADPREYVGYLTDPNESINFNETTMLNTTGGVGGTAGSFCVNNKQHAAGFNIDVGIWKATMWRAYNRIYSPPPSNTYNSPPITLGAGVLPGGDKAIAYSINESDEVVGNSNSSQGNRAFYWSSSNGLMIDLNDYIHPDSGWTLQYARGINEIGQIVGYGINPDGDTRAFLLTRECQYKLLGDMDDNCKFDLADFAIMASNWLVDCGEEPLDPDCVLK